MVGSGRTFVPELPPWEGIEVVANGALRTWEAVDAGLNFFDLQTGEMHVLFCTSERDDGQNPAPVI